MKKKIGILLSGGAILLVTVIAMSFTTSDIVKKDQVFGKCVYSVSLSTFSCPFAPASECDNSSIPTQIQVDCKAFYATQSPNKFRCVGISPAPLTCVQDNTLQFSQCIAASTDCAY